MRTDFIKSLYQDFRQTFVFLKEIRKLEVGISMGESIVGPAVGVQVVVHTSAMVGPCVPAEFRWVYGRHVSALMILAGWKSRAADHSIPVCLSPFLSSFLLLL